MAFFLDEINECLWDHLKSTDKKIVLYGMGDGAEKIKSVLDGIGVNVDAIMASDEFVRGHSFLGYKVKKLSEIEEEFGEVIILVCFGSSIPEVMEHIIGISKKHELYAPNVPVAGEGVFDLEFAKEHRDELKKVYDLLADAQSKKVFEDIIRYKLSGKLDYLIDAESDPSEKFDILNIGVEETYVDLGAYDGDTVIEFLNETSLQFKKIYAVEPDSKSFRKMKRRLYMLGSSLIEAYNCGAWNEDTTVIFSMRKGRGSTAEPKKGEPLNPARFREVKMIKVDSMLRGESASYIKIDAEGAEENAIMGAKETIVNFSPKLNIALYHRNEDMYKLPLLINSINKKYKLYMRHNPYIPDWDTNLFAVCK